MVRDILIDSLMEIDSLEEYYFSQKKSVAQNVKNSLKKYKYGITLHRFFWNRILQDNPSFVDTSELATLELSIAEKETVEKLLQDYQLDTTGNAVQISYKLKPDFNESSIETDPIKAIHEVRKLIQQPDILNGTTIMMLLIRYESMIAHVFRCLIEQYPNAYLADKSITFSEWMNYDSTEDIKECFINREIEDIMRKPLADWYKAIESKHKIHFLFKDEFDVFKEIYYRRNLIVHNQGIVNEVYKRFLPDSTLKIGEQVKIDSEYIEKAFVIVRKVIVRTVWTVRKVECDETELESELFDYAFDCLQQEKWEISEYIFRMLLEDKKLPEIDQMVNQVNLWIAIKNLRGMTEIEEEIRNLDVSAKKKLFAIAKSALLDEHETVTKLLDKAIDNDISSTSIKTWPLFKQYRETEWFKNFVNNHSSSFERERFEQDGETLDSTENELRELNSKLK